jgi:hypothetical protein
MDPIVYVMLYCLHPTIAPSVTVCNIAHVYAKQADCDIDAARLARIPVNKNNGTEFRCTDAIKVKTERMPEELTC